MRGLTLKAGRGSIASGYLGSEPDVPGLNWVSTVYPVIVG